MSMSTKDYRTGKNTTQEVFPQTTESPQTLDSPGNAQAWDHEEFEEDTSIVYAGDRPDRKLQDAVKETEEETGLDFDHFDDIRVENLPEGSLAQTRRVQQVRGENSYLQTLLVADPDLTNRVDHVKNHALVHENVHGLHFQDKLYDTLVDRGIGKEDAGKLRNLVDQDRSIQEGTTEFITHLLDPNSERVGRRFYRDEMSQVEEMLEVESELVQEIEDTKQELIDNYRDVYDAGVAEGIYMEQGEFAGQQYDALVVGEGAETHGKEIVQDYLAETHYDEEGDYQDFTAEDVHLDRGILKDDPAGDYMQSIQENDYLDA